MVSTLDLQSIFEVHDRVCIMFLWASSRMCMHLYIAERGVGPIRSYFIKPRLSFSKHDILMSCIMLCISVKLRLVVGVAVVENGPNPMSSYMIREGGRNNVVFHNGGDSDGLALIKFL
jgi:hypothetical protein